MYLISKEKGNVRIECDNCGQENFYTKKHFSYITDTACINKTLIQCANCNKQVPPNSKFLPKEDPAEKEINNSITQFPIDDVVKCPRCGSTQLTAGNKGYGVGKAAAGVVLFGAVGLVGGLIGSNKTMVTCLKCGRKWEAGKR